MKIDPKEFIRLIKALPVGETFDFYSREDEPGKYEDAFGITKLELFDAVTIIGNAYGGSAAFLIDCNSSEYSVDEELSNYLDYILCHDGVYLSPADNLPNDIPCNEVIEEWLKMLLEKNDVSTLKGLTSEMLLAEIEETEYSIDNEKLWALGTPNKLVITLHEDNIETMREYIIYLDGLLPTKFLEMVLSIYEDPDEKPIRVMFRVPNTLTLPKLRATIVATRKKIMKEDPDLCIEDAFKRIMCDTVAQLGMRSNWHCARLEAGYEKKNIWIMEAYDYSKSFINDAEKMADFRLLTKEEFLASYSYLNEDEYEETVLIADMIAAIKRELEDLLQSFNENGKLASENFETLFESLNGHNKDEELFDFNYKDILGTVLFDENDDVPLRLFDECEVYDDPNDALITMTYKW